MPTPMEALQQAQEQMGLSTLQFGNNSQSTNVNSGTIPMVEFKSKLAESAHCSIDKIEAGLVDNYKYTRESGEEIVQPAIKISTPSVCVMLVLSQKLKDQNIDIVSTLGNDTYVIGCDDITKPRGICHITTKAFADAVVTKKLDF